MGNRIYQDIEIRGVVYPDADAAAAAFGVTADAVRMACRRGTQHRIGTGAVGVEPMRVRIAGRDFETAKAAAAHFGVHTSAVYAAIRDGDPDRVARPAVYNPWKSRRFSIGGLTFPSMSAASRALGFTDEYIAQVMRRGSERGRERILAAAMAYVAQGKHGGGAA